MNTYTEQGQFLALPRLSPVVKILLIANGVVFLAQTIARALFHSYFIEYYFSLGPNAVLQRWVWQFVTCIFLHKDFMHVLMNMLGLYFFGPEVERAIGTKRFLILYFGSGILGGVGWLAINGLEPAHCLGASGAVFGILGSFAGLFPNRRITLLLFFILPVTMSALTMAVIFGIISFFSMLSPGDSAVAESAHLAGGIAGYLYGLYLAKRYALGLYDYSDRTWTERPGWFSRLRLRLKDAVRNRNRPPTRAEVDRVLDKMAAQGFDSLTRSERDILDRASGRGR